MKHQQHQDIPQKLRSVAVRGVSALLAVLILALSAAPAAAIPDELIHPFYNPDAKACLTGGSTTGFTTNGNDVLSLTFPVFTDDATLAGKITDFVSNSTSGKSPWLAIPNFGTRFVAEAKARNVNPMFIATIGRKESANGTAEKDGVLVPAVRLDNNSFGNKGSGFAGYRYWPSFEASLIGDNSWTAQLQTNINGGHSSYTNVKNMYDYVSVHLTGGIHYPGDGFVTTDPQMNNVAINIDNVIGYYKSVVEWIGQMTGLTLDTSPNAAIASDCSSGAVVKGSIVDTALALAWTDKNVVQKLLAAQKSTDGICSMLTSNPNSCGASKVAAGGLISEKDARTEYSNAVHQFNSSVASDGNAWAFSDCGVFVSTVMKASGVDDQYYIRGTPTQASYVTNHPELYDVVPFTDTSQVQPGDILISDGHTYIFVGKNTLSDFQVAEASWGQHVPAVDRNLTFVPGYIRARKK